MVQSRPLAWGSIWVQSPGSQGGPEGGRRASKQLSGDWTLRSPKLHGPQLSSGRTGTWNAALDPGPAPPSRPSACEPRASPLAEPPRHRGLGRHNGLASPSADSAALPRLPTMESANALRSGAVPDGLQEAGAARTAEERGSLPRCPTGPSPSISLQPNPPLGRSRVRPARPISPPLALCRPPSGWGLFLHLYLSFPWASQREP